MDCYQKWAKPISDERGVIMTGYLSGLGFFYLNQYCAIRKSIEMEGR